MLRGEVDLREGGGSLVVPRDDVVAARRQPRDRERTGAVGERLTTRAPGHEAVRDDGDIGTRDRRAGPVLHRAADGATGGQAQLDARARVLAVDGERHARRGCPVAVRRGETPRARGDHRHHERAVSRRDHSIASRIDDGQRLGGRGRDDARTRERLAGLVEHAATDRGAAQKNDRDARDRIRLSRRLDHLRRRCEPLRTHGER